MKKCAGKKKVESVEKKLPQCQKSRRRVAISRGLQTAGVDSGKIKNKKYASC